MVTLSAFADEVSKDLVEQMDVLEGEGIRHIELRGVWGKNVKDLSDDEVTKIKRALDERGFGISAIGSPIGKVGINDDFHQHLTVFGRILEIAEALETEYIRVFSFFMPENEDPEKYRADVLGKLAILRDLAADRGLALGHENEKGIYGDTGARCVDIMENLHSDSFFSIFDPANFVQGKQRPYEDCFTGLRRYVRYGHIKDAVLSSGKVVPAGQGDGDIKRILQELNADGFEGFLSLEPHLSVAGHSHGETTPDLFRTAARALKGILDEIGVSYR